MIRSNMEIAGVAISKFKWEASMIGFGAFTISATFMQQLGVLVGIGVGVGGFVLSYFKYTSEKRREEELHALKVEKEKLEIEKLRN